MDAPDPSEQRVLVLTPTGRDPELTREVLTRAGLECTICAGFDDLLAEVRAGVGVIVIADEILNRDTFDRLKKVLEEQEPWSDVPLVIAASAGRSIALHDVVLQELPRAGSVTILERPLRIISLVTAIRSGRAARKRQYELRRVMSELERNMERLETERRARERFVSVLAHDLRGPLSAAKMAAQLLGRSPERLNRRRDLASRMVRSVERMERMIHDLLDVSRIQAGERLPLRLDACDLPEIARDVAEELCMTHEEGRVVARGEERLEGIWSAEELRRAIWNLATNAIKYGAPGAPVEIRIGRSGAGAWVGVHNQGPAIPPDEQAGLFDAFRRSAKGGPERGWGLGLALVRAAAEAHGGSVHLESAPEEGTTFTIRLPLDSRPFQGGAA